MTGMAMFGAIAFVPLFVQGVLGGTATQAGQVLTPLFLGWVLTSVVSARLTVRIGYRPVTFAGVALLSASFVVLAMLDTEVTLFTLSAPYSPWVVAWACRCCRCCSPSSTV